MTDLPNRINQINAVMNPVVGLKLTGYSCYETNFANEPEQSRWDDLPVILKFDEKKQLSIVWSQIDELFLSWDDSLPFDPEGGEKKLDDQGIPELDSFMNATLEGVYLGRDEFSVEQKSCRIFTRFLLEFGTGRFFEIYNALDENGYWSHDQIPAGEWHLVLKNQ